ncbi:MAG TPA: DUF4149 domain-containing protein [Pyrinomonadaceae bacterium]|nr:DUF4149 domain-containing protein [Pyrinomonadaceae bacterium]
MKLLNGLQLFLLAAWVGAALFFSAVVAPAAFSVLRAFGLSNANEIAGALVTRTLAVVNISGVVVGLILIAMVLVLRRDSVRRSFLPALISAIVLVGATSVGEWVIAARMRALRAAMVLPIDQVPIGDPHRIAFNELHGYSVAALSIAMIAALVAFISIAYRARFDNR